MRLMRVSSLKPGERLSYAIRTQDGRILLPGDSELSKTFIERLESFGISSVYVADDIFTEVEARPCLQDETKTMVLNAVASAYKIMDSKRGNNQLINFGLMKQAAADLVDDVKKAIISEPIGLLNLYAVTDPRCLHAVNVATVTAALALENGCNTALVEEYTLAALLHDIHLETMEQDTDPKHAEITKEYMKLSREYSVRTYMAVAMHHEKYDGTGSQKYAGEKISEGARMIRIADTFDNLVYGYNGFKKCDMNYAVEQLNTMSGKSVDPQFLAYFNSSVAIYPVGITVVLNNGVKAVVTGQNTKMPARPKVRLSMPNKADCMEINLVTSLTTFIQKVL